MASFKRFEDDDALVYDMSLWSAQKEALVIEKVEFNNSQVEEVKNSDRDRSNPHQTPNRSLRIFHGRR